MRKAVIGIVETRAEAVAVVESLRRTAHIDLHDISVLLSDRESTHDFAHEHHTKAPDGAITGATAGSVLGGTFGLLAGIGALALPGIGPLIGAGPVLAALSGAAAGAAVGGLAGALVGLGIPEDEAQVFEGKLRNGHILVAVHTESREAQHAAVQVLRQAGAHDVGTTSDASLPRDVLA